jgi:hypothetical protein
MGMSQRLLEASASRRSVEGAYRHSTALFLPMSHLFFRGVESLSWRIVVMAERLTLRSHQSAAETLCSRGMTRSAKSRMASCTWALGMRARRLNSRMH